LSNTGLLPAAIAGLNIDEIRAGAADTIDFLLKDKNSLKIEKTYNPGFDYLKGITLDDIMKVEFDSTVEVLNKRKLPIRVITLKELNERSLSQLLMQYMLETIVFGKALGINPFGQPAVEERKILARDMLANLKK
jgi:glucose-6-phosphate isomerase